jgi:hypothetical protein
MNKKNTEQISSGNFNYLLNLGRVTSVSGVAKQCQYHTNCNNSYLRYILFLVKKNIPRYYIYQYLGIFVLPETSAWVAKQCFD